MKQRLPSATSLHYHDCSSTATPATGRERRGSYRLFVVYCTFPGDDEVGQHSCVFEAQRQLTPFGMSVAFFLGTHSLQVTRPRFYDTIRKMLSQLWPSWFFSRRFRRIGEGTPLSPSGFTGVGCRNSIRCHGSMLFIFPITNSDGESQKRVARPSNGNQTRAARMSSYCVGEVYVWVFTTMSANSGLAVCLAVRALCCSFYGIFPGKIFCFPVLDIEFILGRHLCSTLVIVVRFSLALCQWKLALVFASLRCSLLLSSFDDADDFTNFIQLMQTKRSCRSL